MKRLIIIYNPRSSRYSEVENEVLAPTRNLKGYTIGKYEVKPTDIDDNINEFAKVLKDGDLIISAGGDATGVIAANAIIKSEKDVTLSVLPYGNFNDLARTLGTKNIDDILSSHKTSKLYPLKISVDGKFFRYATCYVTIGMTAAAVHLYDQPKMRKKLKTKFGRDISSYTSLASWYFKHRHKKVFLPEFTLNGVKKHPKTSDYAAVNGRSMARVMKGGDDFLDSHRFRHETDRLTSFFRLAILMIKSIIRRIPGSDTTGDVIDFTEPSTTELQAEGEHKVFKNIKTIDIKKDQKCLKVIRG